MMIVPLVFEKSQGRDCNKCTKCCDGWLSGTAHGYDFSPGNPCRFVIKGGCNIYPVRPENPCKTFQCHWKQNTRIPEWMKPDQSQVIILPRYLGEKRYLRLFNTGRWPESRVFEWAEEYSKNGQNLVGYDRTGIRVFTQDTEFLELAKKELGL